MTYPQPVPDLDTNYIPHQNSNGSRISTISTSSVSSSSTITVKGELPAIPSHRATYENQNQDQGTVRTTPKRNREGSYDSNRSPGSDESDGERHAESVRHQLADAHLEDEVDTDIEDDLEERTMLDSVVLPAIASVCPRFNAAICFWVPNFFCLQLVPRVSTVEARTVLSQLQRAFAEAERIIPGLTNELVNEIVDSVEHVEDDR